MQLNLMVQFDASILEFRKKSKPLYDSRGDRISAAVACAAAAAATAAAAAAAAARGRSYINHRAEASTERDCCWGKPSTLGLLKM